jgi:hypothetical protein
MATIYVKAKPGRRVPFEGRIIPTDEFVPVPDIPYIRGWVTRWGDLEVQGGELPKQTAKKSRPSVLRPGESY